MKIKNSVLLWLGFAAFCFVITGVILVTGKLSDMENKLEQSTTKIENEIQALKNVSDEIVLYKHIEDIWFEKGRDFIDDITLRELSLITYRYSKKHGSKGEIPLGLDYWKIFAWIDLESGFDPDAISYAGAMGLTQQMYITAIDSLDRYFGLSGLTKGQILVYAYNPLWNFRMGLERLIDYQQKFITAGVASTEDWKLTFSLYNWSTKAVSSLMEASKKGTPKASLKYALSIERKMKDFL